jgi:hypothetical protein
MQAARQMKNFARAKFVPKSPDDEHSVQALFMQLPGAVPRYLLK